MALVLLLYALFASLFTLQKETLLYSEPFFLVGFRMTVAGLLLLAFVLLRHVFLHKWRARHTWLRFFHITGERLYIKRSTWGWIVLLGISNIYLTNVCEIWGIQHMVSSKACLLYSLSPFFAAFVAFIVLKEVLKSRQWLGMALGFLGLLPVHFMQNKEELLSGNVWLFSRAELSILGAVLFSVTGWIVLKKILIQGRYSLLLANALSMLLGGVLALLHSYYSGETWQPVPVYQWQYFLLYSIVMCIISNIICYNLYGHLLKRFSATFMAFAGLVTPLFASLYGYVFLHEQISWHFVLSMLLFAAGLWVFYSIERRQNVRIASCHQ
jgi:drug/metabolite transporter (DMT)-like permease